MIDKDKIEQAVIKASIKYPKVIQQVWTKPCGSPEIVEMINTRKQQLASLLLFAEQLGYVQSWTEQGSSFCSTFQKKPKMQVVSFNTMVTWHNTGFMPSWHHGVEKELPVQAEHLGFDVNNMVNAINARLYQQVFLHSRKDKTVSCYKHVLRFA